MSVTTPDRSRLGLFLGVLVAAVLALVGAGRLTGVGVLALLPAYMFSPLVAGTVTCLVHDVSVGKVGLRVGRPRWLALAGVASLPMVGLTLLFAVLVPGIGFDPAADPIPGLALPSGVVGVVATLALVLALGLTVNAAFAFGEEFGWRGYLLWELAPLDFWRASAATGALWGVWHAPAVAAGYNYPSFPLVGIGMMTVACLALSPLYTYLVVRAESVIAAALLHGVFNGSAGLVLAYTATDSTTLAELVASPVGAAGIVAFGLAAVAIAATGPPALDRSVLGAE
ncbi:CPBP family intramembrane metalloprotease domain-containing protein [Halobacteriales archaeon QS_1_69_70]|nr:MAG: CPBP family intramembrane metalloprotease domain-containing protein [Halobacteriales archaeon QS_1_69_70]